MTHYEFMMKYSPGNICSARHLTFGNRCLNCGYDPKKHEQLDSNGKEYGAEFWNDYANFLSHEITSAEAAFSYFTDATISFFKLNS